MGGAGSGADGVPFAFLNGLEVSAQTGIIYFTDSSSRWERRHVYLEVKPKPVNTQFSSANLKARPNYAGANQPLNYTRPTTVKRATLELKLVRT